MRDLLALRRALTLALLMIGTVVVPAGAAAAIPTGEGYVPPPVDQEVDEEHCVADVQTQRSDGELVLGEMRCYETFAAAVDDVSDGALSLAPSTPGSAAFTDSGLHSSLMMFTLGIHYQGLNGNGSSIAISGSSCSGGWWNAIGYWGNRISSSYNGCYRLRHWDHYNKGGISASTYGRYRVHNLPSYMRNRTNSVSYH